MAYRYRYDEEEKEIKPQKLETNRNVCKLIILSILTLGVYGIVFFIPFSYDLDKVAPNKNRAKTMNYLVAYVLYMFTFSIILLLWHHQIAERIEDGLIRRNISYDFGTNTFWEWRILGSLILIGPFIYLYKLCKAMNLLCSDYNERPICE